MSTETNTHAEFFALPLIRSSYEVDAMGNMRRIEVRRCETTGIVLKGTFPVPSKRKEATGR